MKKTCRQGILKTLFIAAAALMITGCAASPSAGRFPAVGSQREEQLPRWYLHPQSLYPEGSYLSAAGAGNTRREAEDQALAGLAQIFEADIQVDYAMQERYREFIGVQEAYTEQDIELAQTTQVRSGQRLMNVQFSEAARDDSGQVYIIAYIERIPTGRLYRDLIDKNNSQILQLVRAADAAVGPIQEYAYVNAASVVAASNDALYHQLRILAPQLAQPLGVPYDYQQLKIRRSQIASRMNVSVDIDGDRNGWVHSAVAKIITDMQFPVTEAEPVMRIIGDFQLEPVSLSSDFKTVRWVLTLDVTGANGSSVIRYADHGRASGITEDAAAAFAFRDIEASLKQQFIPGVTGYFDGIVLGK